MKTQTVKLLVTLGIKHAEEDFYDKGCDPRTSQEYDFEDKPQVFDSLDELADRYGLSCDRESWQLYDGRLMHQRVENEDGSEPTKSELRMFKKGKWRLWLVDYNFDVHLIEDGDAS